MGNIAPNDGPSSPTASAIVAQAVFGSHVVKIDGYSRIKGLGNGTCIKSETFTIRGHPYCNDNEIELFIVNLFCLFDHFCSSFSKCICGLCVLRALYFCALLERRARCIIARPLELALAATLNQQKRARQIGFLRAARSATVGDALRWDVSVSKEIFTEPIPPHVVVPPSNMHQHLGQLLLAGEAADVTFEVGEETLAAHRCILAARSPVFRAQLLGPMKEKTATQVLIDDMEARVFKALLHFIYTDSLPAMDEGGAAEIAQHLLVAADRYDMERLKLICEGKLSLAEQHGCGALKKACVKFLMSPGNLKAVMQSDGCEHVRSSCPAVLDELLAKLAP
ncbi:hypothetical protein VPH35_131615 [Triticum aestivum]